MNRLKPKEGQELVQCATPCVTGCTLEPHLMIPDFFCSLRDKGKVGLDDSASPVAQASPVGGEPDGPGNWYMAWGAWQGRQPLARAGPQCPSGCGAVYPATVANLGCTFPPRSLGPGRSHLARGRPGIQTVSRASTAHWLDTDAGVPLQRAFWGVRE